MNQNFLKPKLKKMKQETINNNSKYKNIISTFTAKLYHKITPLARVFLSILPKQSFSLLFFKIMSKFLKFFLIQNSNHATTTI